MTLRGNHKGFPLKTERREVWFDILPGAPISKKDENLKGRVKRELLVGSFLTRKNRFWFTFCSVY